MSYKLFICLFQLLAALLTRLISNAVTNTLNECITIPFQIACFRLEGDTEALEIEDKVISKVEATGNVGQLKKKIIRELNMFQIII